MAPYLLFGFAVAGLLYVLISKDFVHRWLGKPGLASVIKASILGVPMPLCSCSVIPVAASLRKSGATRGATASFLSSTPQTGIDSILATYALLGGFFSVVRLFVAFVCGVFTGYLIELFSKKPERVDAPVFTPISTHHPLPLAPKTIQAVTQDCCSTVPAKRNSIEALRYGFLTLPADLSRALMLGLILAGLFTTLIPEGLLSGAWSQGPLSFLLATLISLPLYVCATASIPMAYALMSAGLSPGATLVFLITGPATNTATIASVWQMLGRSATAIYLISLLTISWLSGWFFNAAISPEQSTGMVHEHAAMHPKLWQHASGILLIGLLIFSVWKRKKTEMSSCCSETC